MTNGDRHTHGGDQQKGVGSDPQAAHDKKPTNATESKEPETQRR